MCISSWQEKPAADVARVYRIKVVTSEDVYTA
jgi:hypothetical protein